MAINPFGIDFDAIERRRDARSADVRSTFLPGIDPAALRIGQTLTISPNLDNGDRSYTTELLTVAAVNSGHVQLRRERDAFGNGLIIVVCSDHYFYAADDFIASQPAA